MASLKSLRGSVGRAGRSLDRARKELEEVVQRVEESEDPSGLRDQLKAAWRALELDLVRFQEELRQFCQRAAEDEDETYANYQDAWEELEYTSRRLLLNTEPLLERIRSNVVEPGPASGNGNVHDADQLAQNMNRLVMALERQTTQHGATAVVEGQHEPVQGGVVLAKLPKLGLPKFMGDPLEWCTFWDRFNNSVGQNPRLAGADKLNYLLGQIEGDPKKMIKSLPLTNNNYDVAVAMLKSRYEDTKLVTSLLYRKLTEMRPVKNDALTLKQYLAELDCTLGSLTAMGQDVDDDNFVTVIMSKLPKPVVTALEMFKDVDEAWTVVLLSKKLSDHVIKLERAAKAAWHGRLDPEDMDFTGDGLFSAENRKRYRGRGKARVSRPKSPDRKGNLASRKKPTCDFCQERHWTEKCRKFPTVNARRQQAKDLKLCSRCLKSGHERSDCKFDAAAYYCEKDSHPSAFCFKKFPKGDKEEKLLADDKDQDRAFGDSDGELSALAVGEQVSLQTALVTVSASFADREHTVQTRALMDPGACRSYCSLNLAKQLGLKLSEGPSLTINRFGDNNPISVPTKTAKLQVRALDGLVSKISVSVIPKITGEVTRRPVHSKNLLGLARKYALADKLPRAKETGPVELLFGSDYYLDFVTGEKIIVEQGLYLLGSCFGYILTGRSGVGSRSGYSLSMCGFVGKPPPAVHHFVPVPASDGANAVEPQIADFWSLEKIGISEKIDDPNDEKAIECFENGVKFENGRYSVPLPWNDNVQYLNSDFSLCLGRLTSLIGRLKRDDQLFATYSNTISDQLQKGVIEEVRLDEECGPVVHYIPHHAVVDYQKETTKVRIVYDGSAKTRAENASLNDALERGPVLLDDIVGHLVRFRCAEIAIISDIEKAFLQIDIQEKDRDALRFLWPKNPDLPITKSNVKVYRFRRVLFGLNCSPALLGLTILHHLKNNGSEVARKIQRGTYVDNVIAGVHSVEEAKDYYKEVKVIFKEASMNMRQWASSSTQFEKSLPLEDRVKSSKTKVLGVVWDREKDLVWIDSKKPILAPQTKRQALSAITRIYDPMGFLSPVTVKGKIMVQELSLTRRGWDSKMTGSDVSKWQEYIQSLKGISDVKIPRKTRACGELMLVAFCDASSSCFATAVYLRSEASDDVQINLLMSKGRLNPSKKLSVPRQELMAILIGVRALQFVKDELDFKIKQKVLFSDSKCALYWVKSGKAPGIFNKNRVKEITNGGKDISLRYVHTSQNPADLATRGISAAEMGSFWWNGPSWLEKAESEWPTWDFAAFRPILVPKEKEVIFEASIVAHDESRKSTPFGINASKYSDVTKLHRVTAWCLRLVSALRGKSKGRGRCLLAWEVNEAKRMWIFRIQHESFGQTIEAIKNEKSHPMMQLGLFLDEAELLRCRGRLSHSALPLASKFPKLLPGKDDYTKLLVKTVHDSLGHPPASQTLNSIRREHWIPRGRNLVTKIVRQCGTCRKASGKPYATPKMPELPMARVAPHPSFEMCGIDYFGPLKMKGETDTRKIWVCLFTCLSTRATHLEIVCDMTTVEFLLAFRRFISRRGKPKTIVSDNAPQFKLVAEVADELWTSAISQPEFQNFCANGGIEWKFITEFAPFMGGVYERIVGIVKSCLRKTVGKALLTFQQLQTLLCECEALVNSRPLVYVGSSDPLAMITPGHFLNPTRAVASPEWSDGVNDMWAFSPTAQDLIENWRKGQNLLNEFWKIWNTEYLGMLRERSQYDHVHNSKLGLKPKAGHVVLVKEKSMPRGSWKFGVITEVCESNDGAIRSAKLRVPSGREIKRPVGLLIPFEVGSGEDEEKGPRLSNDDREQSVVRANDDTPRPRRKAAEAAAQKIKALVSKADRE